MRNESVNENCRGAVNYNSDECQNGEEAGLIHYEERNQVNDDDTERDVGDRHIFVRCRVFICKAHELVEDVCFQSHMEKEDHVEKHLHFHADQEEEPNDCGEANDDDLRLVRGFCHNGVFQGNRVRIEVKYGKRQCQAAVKECHQDTSRHEYFHTLLLRYCMSRMKRGYRSGRDRLLHLHYGGT